MSLRTADDTNFEKEVINSELPCLVDLWAPWCGPCKALEPTVKKIAEEFEGKLNVFKVNVDASPEVSAKYSVMSIPTLLFFKNGEVKEQSVGLVNFDAIKEKVNSML